MNFVKWNDFRVVVVVSRKSVNACQPSVTFHIETSYYFFALQTNGWFLYETQCLAEMGWLITFLKCLRTRKFRKTWQLILWLFWLFSIFYRIFQGFTNNYPETYSEPCQTAKIECFAKIVNGSKPLTIFLLKLMFCLVV